MVHFADHAGAKDTLATAWRITTGGVNPTSIPRDRLLDEASRLDTLARLVCSYEPADRADWPLVCLYAARLCIGLRKKKAASSPDTELLAQEVASLVVAVLVDAEYREEMLIDKKHRGAVSQFAKAAAASPDLLFSLGAALAALAAEELELSPGEVATMGYGAPELTNARLLVAASRAFPDGFGSDDVRALDQLPAAQLELVSALGASWGGSRDELLNSAALLEL